MQNQVTDLVGGKTNKQMRAENRSLLASLGMDAGFTFEEWEAMLPQPLRDNFAARALIECHGDGYLAAARLGFRNFTRVKGELKRLFETPGVLEILSRTLTSPEENRSRLIERQVEIALYAPNKESTRAFHELAMVCGWKKGPDVIVQNNRQTILALVTQKDARGELRAAAAELPPSFLEHEPGSAVRIDSGDESIREALDDEL